MDPPSDLAGEVGDTLGSSMRGSERRDVAPVVEIDAWLQHGVHRAADRRAAHGCGASGGSSSARSSPSSPDSRPARRVVGVDAVVSHDRRRELLPCVAATAGERPAA